MAHSAIGLDIGSATLRAAHLSFARRSATLVKVGQIAVPDGAVVDGAVIDGPAVTAALRTLWRQERFASRTVHLGVANQRVVVRQLDLPDMPIKDLTEALPYQVGDVLPMPVEAAVLDFYPLGLVPALSGAPMLRGLLVAADRDMVRANVAAVQAAGLKVASVDLVPFALLRSVGSRLSGEEGAEALVDVGARVTNIVVHTSGVAHFVRILPIGGQDLTDAVAEQLGIPHAEAEVVKCELGLGEDPDTALGRALHGGIQRLLGEVASSLGAHAASEPEHAAGRVVLTGGGAQLQGLSAHLAEALRLPVTIGDATAHLHGSLLGGQRGDRTAGLPSSAVPVGLALGAAL